MSTTTTQETSRTRAEAPQGACVVPYRALQDALRTTALGTGKQVPVLGQVMVEFRTDGRVTLTTYNYDSAVTVTLEGSVSVAGRMLVRHDTMTKVLAAAVKGARKAVLDSATVDLEVVDGEPVIRAQGYTVPLEAAVDLQDWPEVPTASAPTHVLERAAFVDTLQRVLVAAEKGDYLPILNGARMTGTREQLEFVATDRYRLARGVVAANGTTEASATLPASVGPLLARLAGDQVGIAVSHATGRELVSITSGPVTAVITALEGDYPRVDRLLEGRGTTRVTVDRADLLEAATRAAAITTASAGGQTPVTVAVTAEGVSIAPGTSAAGKATAPVLAAETEGEAATVATNPPFLVEAIKTVTAERVTIGLDTAGRPLTFTAAEVEADPSGYRHVLMPVRLA